MTRRTRRGARPVLALAGLAIVTLVVTAAAGGGVGVDTTPPTISANVSPPSPDGNGGWYKSTVNISWTVDDPESPVTATNGCDPVSFSNTSGTTVTCQATSTGGTSSDSVSVKVDTTAPVLNGLSNVTETTNDPSGKAVTFSVGSSEGSPSCSPSSGSNFPVGTTTVNCNVSDPAGNTDSGSFTVTVNFVDNTPPAMSQPSNITGVQATSAAGAAVSYAKPTATDANPANPTVNCSPDTGATFPLGTTTVNCSATDAANNTATRSFTVTVVDTTPPTLGAMPGTMTVQATSPSGAVVSYTTPTATDAVSAATVTCSPASGSTLPRGSHTVSCTAKDASNNTSAPGTFAVNVVDTVAPTLGAMPASITANATSASGAAVSYTLPGGSDAVGPVTVTCTPGPGSTFPVGTTTVSCTARDGAGNASAPGTFTVTVSDTSAPTVGAHAPVTAEATSTSGAAVTYSPPTATDNVTASPTVTCAPASGSTFPIGASTVSCTARDAAGNTSAPGTFTVTVQDKTPPIVSVPADRTLEASGPGGTTTFFDVSASDLGEPLAPGAVSCSPKSGATFGLGTTTVTCTATDPRGNSGTGAFKVIVSDNTPPGIFAPSEANFFADSPSGIARDHPAVARVLSSAGAQDIVDSNPSVHHDAPAVFPLGVTIVTFTARDKSGNFSTARLRVSVTPRPANQPTGQPQNPTVDLVPPANVRGLTASSQPGVIVLRWQSVGDAEQYEVYREANQRSTQAVHDGTLVYRGKNTRFEDRKTTAGIEYRYTVVSVDKAGNKAVGQVVVALARKLLLLQPRFGAKSSKPPVLVVAPVAGASYYNIQIFRGTQKILSVWPAGTRHAMQRTWKYAGKSYRLSPGVYKWFAWPGIGRREDAKYGPVMGESTFTVTAAKPAKKATGKAAKKKTSTKKKTTAKKKR